MPSADNVKRIQNINTLMNQVGMHSIVICNGKNVFWLGFNKYVNGFQILLGFMIMYAAALSTAPLADFTKYVVNAL